MKSVNVNGIKLYCEDRGSGKPILLVHGFPLNHAMWAAQFDVLAAQYRVIAPDLRGFGRSVSLPCDNSLPCGKTTMPQFADDMAALLDAIAVREPIVFCGLSMGGYIAFSFLRKYAARLRGLILCDTRAAADAPATAEARLVAADGVLRDGPRSLVEGMLPRVFGKTTLERHPAVVESLRQTMMSAPVSAIAAAQRGMAERVDATDLLATIACPTLVLVGEEDLSSPPAEMRVMARAIPHSQYIEIPSAGHLTPMENPAAVNTALLAFLAAT
jgi:3-oxoadipate enol-lactonase